MIDINKYQIVEGKDYVIAVPKSGILKEGIFDIVVDEQNNINYISLKGKR